MFSEALFYHSICVQDGIQVHSDEVLKATWSRELRDSVQQLSMSTATLEQGNVRIDVLDCEFFKASGIRCSFEIS